jgi:hypothetical protein
MDYPFENLDPERFQQFCQALLIRDYPNIQCFPVGQPDGGRDALEPLELTVEPLETVNSNKGFIVFQVKFSRKPLAEADPHIWLASIMKEEIPKIKKLIPEGAVKYYLLTNIPGTAHPNTGSIDILNKMLKKELNIPSQCWWRDDLNRRLDNASELKWVYPELMTGLDILQYTLEIGLSEEKERRTNAIRSFVKAQYEDDEEVRFKQVELQNKLLDLFIDVPARYTSERDKDTHKYRWLIRRIYMQNRNLLVRDPESKDYERMGAATLLLNPLIQEGFPQIVLEGAPGQGKSTIAQYVCQVHRMNILQKTIELANIPNHLKPTSIHVPFKVDLRDLATWLSNKDPFSPEESKVSRGYWQKSLESFLAYQVRVLSGGFDFSVQDLHAVAKHSPFLIVLDGLDEVADITQRQEIVSTVKIGINRLKESCKSLQVVITSRPTAFVNSPGFPESTYPRFELTSITRSLIDQYTNKWIKARKLNVRDSIEVRKTLKEKLDQPHLRELSRNPMQLAILLSLINARGSSLPDKRTALYDSYVELFFNRESEKSAVVREHRDLLIDIHRYLAWILHSEAEQGQNRGSISSERLQKLLGDYLITEGNDASIANRLFTGMIERVVALVSRVQDTYEFEVQPLREYFAARYLYETAPYSPPGAEHKGTKPDRFDAISRNFYWLNVTRFYAGCFSKGELPTLVDSLEVLLQAEGYRNISHPRILAAMLLSDWVFTQNPRSMKSVIKLVLDGLGLRSIITYKNRTSSSTQTLTLPKNCGHDELIEQCFKILVNKPTLDYALEVIDLIKANAKADEISNLWERHVSDIDTTERTLWLRYGLYLGILQVFSEKRMEEFIAYDPDNIVRLQILLRSSHVALCESSETRCKAIVHSILNGDFIFHPRPSKTSEILPTFCQVLDISFYNALFTLPDRYPLDHALFSFEISALEIENEFQNEQPRASKVLNDTLKKCKDTIKFIKQEYERPVIEWKTSLTPWNSIIEHLRSQWGEQWTSYRLANIATSIYSSKEPFQDFQDFQDLLDHSKPLCLRAFYARSKSRSSEWWKKQLTSSSNELDVMFVSLMLLTWGNSHIFMSLYKLMNDFFDGLSTSNWRRIVDALQNILSRFRGRKSNSMLSLDIDSLPREMSDRILLALSIRLRPELAEKLYLRHFSNYDGSESTVLNLCQESLLKLANSDPYYWEQALEVIEKNYSIGIPIKGDIFSFLVRETGTNILPTNIAETITSHAEKYPRSLVKIAEAKNREVVSSKIIPVGEIAKRDLWFI